MAIRGDRGTGIRVAKVCVTCGKVLEKGQLFFCKQCLAELTILPNEDPKVYYKRIEQYGKR